jgi:hypothetical protein
LQLPSICLLINVLSNSTAKDTSGLQMLMQEFMHSYFKMLKKLYKINIHAKIMIFDVDAL